MAYSSVFDFHAGDSLLHCLDVRFKLVILIMVNLAIAQSDFVDSALLSVGLILLMNLLKVPIKSLLWEIRILLILLLFVFSARAFSEAGSTILPGWPITTEGIRTGGLVCWRLVMIVLSGLIFIRTSRPWEIKASLHRFLSLIPKLPAHRISLMFSLMFRFIPLVIEIYAEISEAQQSRAVGLRKNPLFRLKVLVIPLMENTFRKADEMVLAMEARCYSDDRVDPEMRSGGKDWMLLVLASIGCVLLMAL